MDRLAEMDEYDSMFGRRLADDDFLAAGYTPQELQAYRGAIVQPSLTPQDRASMEAQYGTLEAPQSQSTNLFDLNPNEFLFYLEEGNLSQERKNELMREYRSENSFFAPLNRAAQSRLDAIADEGRRPIVGGFLSKPEGSLGMDALRNLQIEFSSGLLGLLTGIGQAVDAPSAAFSGLIPNEDVSLEALNVAGAATTGSFAAIRPDNSIGMGGRERSPSEPPRVTEGPSLTFDDVERAMEVADVVNQPIDQQPVSAPRITPSDLEGARIIPTVADLTRAGGFYTGIDSSLIDVPEVMMGGPGFPLLPSSQQNGLIWAVQGKGIGTKKAGKGADLIAVTAMNPTSHRSNISFINSLIKTTDAYVRDGRIGDNVISALDDAIRQAGSGGDQSLVGLARFPGFKSPNAQEFINNATFQERSRIASVIGTKEMQEAGAPNVNRVLEATVDPKYAGANPRDTLLFIEPDFSLPPVDLAAEGLPVHPSYRYGIRGRVFGALDQNISTFEMFPTFWGEKNINAFGEGFNTGGRRAFDMSLPIEEVTGEQVRNLERIMTTEAARSTNLTAIDTRLLVNSLTDNWKPTTTSVKAGGASPQAFVDAIQNNKYRPALTNYTPQEVKAGARSGDLVAYQLGDDDVFFALDAKPDYSWAGVDMMPGDKALVGVVSNAPGSRGTAAPSVIAKALDEGANILDAFAVPSESFPDGFLPQYYGEFGFEEVGRVPFDKDMYVADHGELAYEDLLQAWRSDGWDESQGMPPVIVMRWNGSDADRRATVAGIRGAGAPSHRAETRGIVAQARGSSGRISDEAVQPQPPSDGRGVAGQAGPSDEFRLSGRARRGAEGILGLTPQQLRNQGIPEDQIQQLMQLRNVGQ